MKPGLDGIMSIDITGMEELKECADNVIGAFITMSEAVEELSGCMLELKVSDPYENKKMESEEVDVCKVGVIESGTGMTTTVVSEKLYSKMTQDCEGINLKIQDASSEEKEVFNAEEIIEDMILKLKEKFNECSLGKESSGAFDREMIVSEEIRKLMECLMMVRDTSDNYSGDCEVYWFPRLDKSIEVGSNSGLYVQQKDNQSIGCYEVESLDQILQVAVDSTIDLVKKDSKNYDDVFGNIEKMKRECSWGSTKDMNDVKLKILKKAKSEVEKELKQTQLPCVK